MPASVRRVTGRVTHIWHVTMGIKRTCIHCTTEYDQDDAADRKNHWPPCWICGGDWGHTACQH